MQRHRLEPGRLDGGFVIDGAVTRIDLFDARSRDLLGRVPLIAGSGSYPGRFEAREASLTEGGRRIEFLECLRGQASCQGKRSVEGVTTSQSPGSGNI